MNLNLDHVNKEWKREGTNLIYFGDMHHRVKAPSSRVDDFEKTERLKVNQLRYLAKEFNARAFIQPGDFLDAPNISEQFMNKIMGWWGFNDFIDARQKYDAGEIDKLTYAEQVLNYTPIIGIVGNHELYGNSYKSFNRTSLNFLSQQGFITLVDKDDPYIIKADSGLTIAITGNPFDMPVNKYRSEADIDYYQQPNKYGDVDIYLTHGYLEGDHETSPYSVLAKDLKTKADITFNGHVHDGFHWFKKGEQWFGNPGAIAQQSNSQTELERTVKATLVHISDNGEVEIVDIPLDLPANDKLFDMDEKEALSKKEEQLDRIKTLINSVNQTEETNTTAIIKAVADEEHIEERVKEIALEKTYDMMNQMGANQVINQEIDYRIKRITLHNFESHQHTEIDLDPTSSPTLVIGESSQGKSSILRAIYWVLENAGDSKAFVRRKRGVKEAYVEIERMDGIKVKRFIEVSKSRSTGELKPKRNGYIITDEVGEEHEYNTSGLSDVQSLFGLNYLQLDDKDVIPINFQKQEDGWYFIGLTDGQRAKVIGALYGTQYITSAIKSLNKDAGQLRQENKLVKSELEEIDHNLETLSYLDQLENDYAKLSPKLDRLSKDNTLYSQMESCYRTRRETEKLYQSLHSISSTHRPALVDIKERSLSLIHRSTLLDTMKNLQQTIEDSCRALEIHKKYKEVHVDVLQQKRDDLIKNKERYRHLSEVYNQRLSNNKELDQLNTLLSNRSSIVELKEQFDQLTDRQEQYNQIRQAYNDRLPWIKEQKEVFGLIEEKQKVIKQVKDEWSARRRSLFTCIDYGVIKIFKPGGENNMELKELSERIERLNNELIVAETQAKAAKKQIESSNEKLKDLGIDPENAREEILSFKKSLDEEFDALTTELDRIEEEIVR